MKYTDLVLLDLKEIDDAKHRDLTGHSNRNILDCARYLSDIGVPIWVRHVLVPGLTDKDDDLRALRAFIDTLQNVKRVEVLPYHAMGAYKWEQLGIPYTMKDVSAPTEERVRNAERILTTPSLCPERA